MPEPLVVRQDIDSTSAAGTPTRTEDSSPAETALLPPLRLSPNPNRSTSPHPDILSPPEDLPPRPRPRSPPCPGGLGTGSRPSTPGPYRPERPGADVGNGMRESCGSVHIEGGQDQVQVEQTPRVRDSVDPPASEIPADARARAGVEVRPDAREMFPGDGEIDHAQREDAELGPPIIVSEPTTVKTEVQEIRVPEPSAAVVLAIRRPREIPNIVAAKPEPRVRRKGRVKIEGEDSTTAVPVPQQAKKRTVRKKVAPAPVPLTGDVKVKVEGATADGPAGKPGKKRAPQKSARVKKCAQTAATDIEKPGDTAKQRGKTTRTTKAKINDMSKVQTTGASAHADSYTHAEWGTSGCATPPRSESFKGRKHPPRTYLYPSTHLTALEGVKWDDTGLECMELSALPCIAGAGYMALEMRLGKRDVLFGERFIPVVLADGSVERRDRRCAVVCIQTRRSQGVQTRLWTVGDVQRNRDSIHVTEGVLRCRAV
ncbi:hypothetical protein C8Q74DRAFT_373909 [Fomes fomentarius]|nr:hypothetical protein C8Q74DRAFT_373909 [Fomes fomentarius]